jgi:hypothetical protein
MEQLHKDALNQNIYRASNDESFNFLSHSSLVNNTKLLFASFNDQIRFLLNNGSLAIATNISDAVREKIVQQNYLTFYFGFGHAALELKCQSCDNGKSFNKFYDLNGPVGVFDKLSDIAGIYDEYNESDKATYKLRLFLNDEQVSRSFSALNNIHDMAKAGKYKFVSDLHNCVSLLVDTYQDSGFSHQLSQYLTNNELMNDGNASVRLLLAYRFHYMYPDSYLDPHRKEVKVFFKTSIAKKYKDDSEVKEYEDFQKIYDNIDLEEAKKDSFIASRIEEIYKTSQEVYPELVELSSHFIRNQGITEIMKQEILDYYLNKNITYIDLYYEHYVPKYQLEVMKLFENTIYQGIDVIQQLCMRHREHSYCKRSLSAEANSSDIDYTPVEEIFLSGNSDAVAEV